jgi:molecular chaperone GrpE (heat shock protein)
VKRRRWSENSRTAGEPTPSPAVTNPAVGDDSAEPPDMDAHDQPLSDPPPNVSAQDDFGELVLGHLERQATVLATIERRLAELEKSDAQRAELFNRLYADLDEQRAARRGDVKSSLYRSLILVVDRVQALLLSASSEAHRDDLRSVLDELIEALEVDGMRQIVSNPATVDPTRQQVVRTTAPEQGAPLWVEVRAGYESEHHVLRPQQIEVAAEPRP